LRSGLRRALAAAHPAVLALVLLGVGGCRPEGPPADPASTRALHAAPKARSAIAPEADRVIDGLLAVDVPGFAQWMSPALRARLDLGAIEAAAVRYRDDYGPPRRRVEERWHREGELRWYSGVYEHAPSSERTSTSAFMLVQFAIDGRGALARLLVREHWPIAGLRHPAEGYVPVNRFHVPSSGDWSVLHGGRRRATNYHHDSPAQRWAYDLVVRVRGLQKPAKGQGNAAFFCYGKPVLAPAPGVVVIAIDGVPENPVGVRGRAGGNGVVIDHGFGEFSALWHGIPGTLKVEVGQRVEVGQHLFDVGNSGSSTGPHIHFHVSTGRPDAAERGLPAPFVDLFVDGAWSERKLPIRGQTIRGTADRPVTARRAAVLVNG
jgi:murein DD-endopeptidase MepM/ murein hydrolase activator NlpD